MRKQDYEVIAVIGDGALTGGNALEAINQTGYLNTKIIIILNDNRMCISKSVGALSEYTHRIEKTETYKDVKEAIHELGHTFGLKHCKNNCVMKSSQYPSDVDKKLSEFCEDCINKLKEFFS